MSEANVALVRRGIELPAESYAAGEAVPELLAMRQPELVVDASHRVFNPEVYDGLDGLRGIGPPLCEPLRFGLGPFRTPSVAFVPRGLGKPVLMARGITWPSLSRKNRRACSRFFSFGRAVMREARSAQGSTAFRQLCRPVCRVPRNA